jgi:PIN domain nuclease of toxin-antitoxin system
MAREIEDPMSELWLSPISAWEVLMLSRKGRLKLDDAPDAWISRAWQSLPFREAPITLAVAREAARLQLPSRDPADHFLVATARVFELTLATADQQLLKTPDLSLLANR